MGTNSWESQETNPGLLGEKRDRYLCAMLIPAPTFQTIFTNGFFFISGSSSIFQRSPDGGREPETLRSKTQQRGSDFNRVKKLHLFGFSSARSILIRPIWLKKFQILMLVFVSMDQLVSLHRQ